MLPGLYAGTGPMRTGGVLLPLSSHAGSPHSPLVLHSPQPFRLPARALGLRVSKTVPSGSKLIHIYLCRLRMLNACGQNVARLRLLLPGCSLAVGLATLCSPGLRCLICEMGSLTPE